MIFVENDVLRLEKDVSKRAHKKNYCKAEEKLEKWLDKPSVYYLQAAQSDLWLFVYSLRLPFSLKSDFISHTPNPMASCDVFN